MANASKDDGVKFVGVDLGDKFSRYCSLDEGRKIVGVGRFATTRVGLRKEFAGLTPRKIILEAGTHSPWVSGLIAEMGHSPIVVDPRHLALVTKSLKKNDRGDAEILARVGSSDLDLVSEVHHRSQETLEDRSVLRLRDFLVQTRSAAIATLRGIVKPFGARLPACDANSFLKKAISAIPEGLRESTKPVLDVIQQLDEQIASYDRLLKKLAEKYPATQVLQQVTGVGPITSLAFVLTIEDPRRFRYSRRVGSYVGLTPRLRQSGKADPQLRITKAGDHLLRKLLVQCAHHIIGHRGPDCDLRRFGLALALRGGKSAKKRAVVAVARKLAVLLHRLWRTGEVYDPHYKHRAACSTTPGAATPLVTQEA
jgi:transposase